MDPQSPTSSVDSLIQKLTKFGGRYHENVLTWLHDIEDICDQVHVQPSNRFLTAQWYLTAAAAAWFRYNKSAICDWVTFKIELVKAFPPLFHHIPLQQDPPPKPFELSLPCHDSSHLVISTIEPATEDRQLAVVPDTQYNTFEALSDQNVNDDPEDCFFSLLVDVSDFDVAFQLRETNASDDLNTFDQHDGPVLESEYSQTDVTNACQIRTEPETSSSPSTLSFSFLHRIFLTTLYDCDLHDRFQSLSRSTSLIDANTMSANNPLYCDAHRGFSIFQGAVLPYADISFTLVREEWDYSYNHRFRCHPPRETVPFRVSFRKWKYRRIVCSFHFLF